MSAHLCRTPVVLAIVGFATPMMASEPGQSDTGSVAETATAPDPNRLETGLAPVVSYDSNLGLGLGALLALTRFDPERDPHRWRLQALALVSTRRTDDGDWQVPAQLYDVRLDLPEIASRLRVAARIGLSVQENVNYFGLGSRAPTYEDRPDRFHQYERLNPFIRGTMRYRIFKFERDNVRFARLEGYAGFEASYSRIALLADSLLRDHATRADSPLNEDDRVLADLVHGTQDHFLLLGTAGLILDLRDNEFHPEKGSFHIVGLRASPGVDASLDYLGLSASTSWFFPVVPRYLVVAARLAGDVIVGRAPFYELSTFGSFQSVQGLGGADSLRGLLLRRFHGKGKVVGNLELRSEFLRFRSSRSPIVLGGLAFADGGRVWADLRPRTFEGRRLDGGPEDLQLGLGAGLRLRMGDTFIIRADYGVSPTDGTTGFYVSSNHVF